MIFDLIELQKTLSEADFTMRRGDTELGHAHLTGSIASMEGKWALQFMGNTFTIAPGKKGLSSVPTKVKIFRPYDIMMDGALVGSVYQTKSNDGFLKSYEFHQLYLNGAFYDMYPLHFGEEGQKTPIYREEQQWRRSARRRSSTMIFITIISWQRMRRQRSRACCYAHICS